MPRAPKQSSGAEPSEDLAIESAAPAKARMFEVHKGWQLYSGLLAAAAMFVLFLPTSFGGATWLLGWVPVATGVSRLIRRRSPKTWFGTSTPGGAVFLVVIGMSIGVIGLVAAPRSDAAPTSSPSSSIRPFVSVASQSVPEAPSSSAITPTVSPSAPSVSESAPAASSTAAEVTVAATTAAAPATTAAKPVTTVAPPPAKTTSQPATVYYANCAAAKAAGAAPLHRGDPGYRPALDRDGDGIACEK